MSDQATNLTQFAYQAARDLGCLRAGQTLSADILSDIHDAANQMLDAWLIDELMITYKPILTFPLVPGVQIYTIGPNETAPNFTADRPTRIEDANVVLNTVNPVLRTPIDVINVDQWASIPVQMLPNTLPTRLYYDKGFNTTTGAGKIYLWGGPLYAYDLELFVWDQSILRAFPDLTTTFIYPPGYQRLIRKKLACEIVPLMAMYCKASRSEGIMMPVPALVSLVQRQADEAYEKIQIANASDEILVGDPAFLGNSARRSFNYLLGTNGRTGR